MSSRSHNWLVYRIDDAAFHVVLCQYATGTLLDVGCGEKPYVTMTAGLVGHHWGLDYPRSLHSRTQSVGLAYWYTWEQRQLLTLIANSWEKSLPTKEVLAFSYKDWTINFDRGTT